MVNLSLTNLDEYMMCVYNLGYSRRWPTRFSQPTIQDLKEVWNGVEDDNVRREAYLVLLNTIPSTLKYLVRNVRSGDVIGIWRAIMDRFFHATPDKVRLLVNEWNTLSMLTLKLPLDKFIAIIHVKATTLKRYGVSVSEEEVVQIFVSGLTKDYGWFRCHQRMNSTKLSLVEASKICLDYAYDHDLMTVKEKVLAVHDASGNSKAKGLCRNFNTAKGCQRNPCPYKHDKMTKPVAIGDKKVLVANTGGRKCFGCNSTEHFLDT